MSTPFPRLRVAHIITQLELGGAQQNTLYTIQHLNSEYFEPYLICGSGGILDVDAKAGAWPTSFVRYLARPVNPIKDLLAFISLYRKLRKIKPHIVHTHSSKAGILGRLAAYLAGVPVIVHTFHGFGFTPGQSKPVRGLFICLERFCARLCTHLIFVSHDNADEARSLGLGKPGSVIRSGIVMTPYAERREAGGAIRSELGIPPDAWLVVSVGNFKPQKNPMDLVKTAKLVLAEDPAIHFLLVGDGELRSLAEKFVQSEGIAPQVHFLGWRQDIPMILSTSNAFLLTSLWEGLPRALVEAAAAGLPAVAYAVNGIRDILIEGETGFPVPLQDAQAAAEKLLWIKGHPQEAKRIAKNSRIRIEKEFDIDKMVHDQEELYRELYAKVPLKEYYEPLWAN